MIVGYDPQSGFEVKYDDTQTSIMAGPTADIE
jgi:hypothetical protein